MIKVGKRDRIFVAVALPLTLLGCHLHFVRQPLVKEHAALTAERGQLPDPDMFPMTRRTLSDRVAEAERTLATVRSEKMPESILKGSPNETEAVRVQAVFDILHAHGVRILKAEPVEARGLASVALQATGTRPEPIARRLVLEVDYLEFVAVLREFEKRKLAVVPSTFALETAQTACRWEVTLCL